MMVAPALLLAACGGGGKSTPTPTVSAATTVPATTTSASGTATSASSQSATATVDLGTVSPNQTPGVSEQNLPSSPAQLTEPVVIHALRTGIPPRAGGWERIVFEFSSTARPSVTVKYVDKAAQCASGQSVSIQGSAILEVTMIGAQAHDNSGTATIPSSVTGTGDTIIGGVQTCDFEGHVTWDFGLKDKHGFDLSALTGPTRIVVDVKQ